jgi:hypothetical protein
MMRHLLECEAAIPPKSADPRRLPEFESRVGLGEHQPGDVECDPSSNGG